MGLRRQYFGAPFGRNRDILWIGGPAVVIFDPLGRVHLGRAANLPDNDHTLRIGVVLEDFQRIHKVRSGEDVASHANAKTLSQTGPRCRRHRLIAERAGLRNDAYFSWCKTGQWLESYATLANGGDDPGAIRPDQTCFGLRFKHGVDLTRLTHAF